MRNTYVRAVMRFFVTLGPIGYLPASGTCGTIAAIPLVYAMRMYLPPMYEFGVYVLLWVISAWCINRVLPDFIDGDPSEIVIDEVIGFATAMLRTPFTWQHVLLIFVMFRIFDIMKPLNIDYIELIPGSWGIIFDDVVAGAFASITVSMAMSLV